MEFRVLGQLEVIGPRGPIRIGGRMRRAIVALLALNAGETVPSERLLDEIWGDERTGGSRHALEVHVSRLRQVLGADRLETQPSGYRLRADGSNVDLQRFDVLVSDATRVFDSGDPSTAAAGFAKALALWRGPALADLASGGFLRGERARLDELRAVVLERWVDAELAAGRHLDMVPELRRIVDEMPLRETFQARLMLALYRSGRQAEALDVYLRAHDVLDRELGVDPGQELEALQRAVLAHDPGLAAAALSKPPALAATSTQDTPDLALSPEAIDRNAPTRRVVTTLMADITASTLTGERVDPEAERLPLDRCFDPIRLVLERHGALVEHLAGDAVMAVFGFPSIHEDDALRAVRAASDMRDVLAAVSADLEREQRLRITMRAGINTGVVVSGRGIASAAMVTGDAVDAATSLERAAGPGEILLGDETYNLVRQAVDATPVGAVDPHGRSGPITAFRLVAVTAGIHGHIRRFDTPLVGRDRELRQLEAAFNRVMADETCQMFSIHGPAGVGKSRLVHEFLRSVRPRAQVLRGRSLPYGERVALWPVADTIRQAAGISDGDATDDARAKIAALLVGYPRASAIAERVSAMVGASEVPSRSAETSWAVRSVFEAIARGRPLVIVFDDVQWGEHAFLDLIEYVADTSRGAPILLLCIARPELLDGRPGWAGGKLNATSILLEPLSEAQVSRLVANLLGGARPSASVERTIADASEGNPLFVEEYLAMLLDEGAIRKAGDEWVATNDISRIATPGTIMALLTARVDRLPGDEREILARAAVVGKVFTREALEALAEREALPDLDRRLGSLVRREIIRPERSTSESGDAYRFKHILLRDAAYAGLPKVERIVLHERLADWLARTTQGELNAPDEVIGAHLEQAYRYRIELGPADDRARDVGREAAARLADVGRRSDVRGDASAAAALLARATALLPRNDRERLVLLTVLSFNLKELGEFAAARETNDELGKQAAAAGFEDLRWRGSLAGSWLDYEMSGTVSARVAEDLQAAIDFFEGVGDDQALARAWLLVGNLGAAGLRLPPSRLAFQRAADYARRGGDVRTEAEARVEITTLDERGPATVEFEIQGTQELLDWARAAGVLWAEALALSKLGRLNAKLGDFDVGRRLLDSAIAIYRELDHTAMGMADMARWRGMHEWLAGDPVAAEHALRGGYEELEGLGERRNRSFAAAHLARMVYLQGRLDEAYAYTQTAEGLLSTLEAWTRVGWRGVRGMILARRGDLSAGMLLAAEEVSMAEATDDLTYQARALEDLAEVLELAGRSDDAQLRLAEAIRLYDQKGITVLAERARRKQTALQR